MQRKISLLLLIFLAGCTVTEKTPRSTHFSVQAGLSHGGITENTDLGLVPDAQATPEATVDAFSGATRTGPNAGIHFSFPAGKGEAETGLDYLFSDQEFTYADQGNGYIGVRSLKVSQLMCPLTYNFRLLSRVCPKAEIRFKAGFLGQYSFFGISDIGLTALPTYSLRHWSQGLTMGVSITPVHFSNGSGLGFYFDVYRGSRLYTDYYNQDGFEMPGSSFMKFGISFHFSDSK